MGTPPDMPAAPSSLHGACRALFTRYPLAVAAEDDIRVIVLMLRDGGRAQLFDLVHDDACPQVYTLIPWETRRHILVSQAAVTPPVAAAAVTQGVPLPADGTLFGWAGSGGRITALVSVVFSYDPADPVHGWQVRPLEDAPEEDWPPFTGDSLYHAWSWEHVRAGRLVPLAPLVASTRRTVLWMQPAEDQAGPGYVTVTADLDGPGYTLPAGRYGCYQDLRDGTAWPSLPDLRDHYEILDLASRPRLDGPRAVCQAADRAAGSAQ